jgi:hypothetical protein
VRAAFLAGLEDDRRVRPMADIWMQADIVRVRRAAPLPTAMGRSCRSTWSSCSRESGARPETDITLDVLHGNPSYSDPARPGADATALDALEQALYDRPRADTEPLIHHSDRGIQYCRSCTRRNGSTLMSRSRSVPDEGTAEADTNKPRGRSKRIAWDALRPVDHHRTALAWQEGREGPYSPCVIFGTLWPARLASIDRKSPA